MHILVTSILLLVEASLTVDLWRTSATKRVLQIPAATVRLFGLSLQGRGSPPLDLEVYHCLLFKSVEEETVPTGTCPECDADVHVDLDTDKGELVSCEECGTELEIVGLDPVELDIVEEDSYDDDEDEDEY